MSTSTEREREQQSRPASRTGGGRDGRVGRDLGGGVEVATRPAPPPRVPESRARTLSQAYADGMLAGGANQVTILTRPTEINARVEALRATLSAVGIEDLFDQGAASLSDRVDVRAGLGQGKQRRGSGSAGLTWAAPTGDVLAVDEAIIVATEMNLADGTELRLEPQVRHLTILAVDLTVGRDCTVTWQPAHFEPRGDAADGGPGRSYSTSTSWSSGHAPDGGDGEPGAPGPTGTPGEAGPTVEVWALEADRLPEFRLAGGAGGDGGRGGHGGLGGNGAKGVDSRASGLKCVQEPGAGGDGGNGGAAGRGGNGGRGGEGGQVLLYLSDATHDSVLGQGLTVDLGGGPGGEAGAPGLPGLMGHGAPAGDPKFPACKARPERGGSPGLLGSAADRGSAGAVGATGRLTATVITEQQFRDKWTSPQVSRVTPSEVHVGDTVKVTGAHFTTRTEVEFAGRAATTTFVADTMLRAEVPSVGTGWVDVVAVDGSERSNPAHVKLLPAVLSVEPWPARVGAPVTLIGSGFAADSTVEFRGTELRPDSVVGGSRLTVTLPAPPPPFEDWGGTDTLRVLTPTGESSGEVDLLLRHVVDTGFVGREHAYSFINDASTFEGVATMKTFEQTYGVAEVVWQFLSNPVPTTAWYLYYRGFFNKRKPGYSSGFAVTAAEAYWGGHDDLFHRYSDISEVESLLTVAQGHVLSHEMLTRLAGQAAAGTERARTSIEEVEGMFRRMASMTVDERRRNAPVMQLMPAGTILTSGYLDKLGSSHGLLPVRVEYPVPGESWYRRLVVYDNATPHEAGSESLVTLRLDGGDSSFTIDHVSLGGLATRDDRSSASGWTLSHVSLEQCWLSPVSMPTAYLFLLSPITAVVTGPDGERFGVAGRKRFDDLPGAAAAPGAPDLYLLPEEEEYDVTLHGTGEGTCTAVLVDAASGTATALWDLPVRPGSLDRLRVRPAGGEVEVGTETATKKVRVVHGRRLGDGFRGLQLTAQARAGESLTLRTGTDLATLALGGEQEWSARLTLVTGSGGQGASHDFGQVPVAAGGSEYAVADWADLGEGSLRPVPRSS